MFIVPVIAWRWSAAKIFCWRDLPVENFFKTFIFTNCFGKVSEHLTPNILDIYGFSQKFKKTDWFSWNVLFWF